MSQCKYPTLYRFFDRYGQLLYVGKSVDPISRFRQHRSDKGWWTQVAGITLQHADECDLDRLERRAIENEHPAYNKMMNKEPGNLSLDSAWTRVLESAATRICTGIDWGWIWYCDECQNHGTADSQQEANALATAHLTFRSLESAELFDGKVGTLAECHWQAIAVVQLRKGDQYIFGRAERFPADWVYHPLWTQDADGFALQMYEVERSAGATGDAP